MAWSSPIPIAPGDIQFDSYFIPNSRATFCEWKGAASYYTISVGDKSAANAAWFYRQPTHPYESLANHIAFYPGKMDACYVDSERVHIQEGDFYGGWITDEIIGPFKGGADTSGW